MVILREDTFEMYRYRLFFQALRELLNPNETIKSLSDYVNDFIEPYVDSDEKRNQYITDPNISEIKRDINDFVKKWRKTLLSLPYIELVEVNPSTRYGLSEYLYVTFKTDIDRLQKFYSTHEELYNNVKFRFTDHPNVDYNKRNITDADKVVDIVGKTLEQSVNEMLTRIKKYYWGTIKRKEKNFLSRERAKLKKKQVDVTERLYINEKLENIANGIYATDSATDVANWLVNKPKAYRILYDSKRDVYGIADAMKATHMDIARHLYRTGYVYLTDEELEKMRSELGSDARYMSAQDLYAKYGFYGDSTMYGLFFIPKQEEYLDYEEQGFYNVETLLTTGSIFARRKSYFSSDGPLSSLYNKLKIMGAIEEGQRKPLEKIYTDCKSLYANDLNYMFNQIAMENGYTKDEINDFLRTLPEYSLSEMFEKYFKMYGLKRAQDMLRLRAARVGYTKKDIEQFLSDMFDD